MLLIYLSMSNMPFSFVDSESRAIEKQGGYNFNSDAVPISFSFGGKAGFA
jgi:hypothetical protein